jgi:hypothetical protein
VKVPWHRVRGNEIAGQTVSRGANGSVSLADVDATTAESVAEAMQALSTASLVRLLARLCEGHCSVGALATSVGLEQSLVSHQLRLLRHLGLGRRSECPEVYIPPGAPVSETVAVAFTTTWSLPPVGSFST